ncbi:MAG TPA: DUF302 domain-containing protein [Marmoricola sp.]|nr:DUF302 domain-containing protein [Marmoricola sp.]
MSDYTLSATLDRTYEDTVTDVRAALADAGFGVLTEIDVRATMRNKLDLEVAPEVILGACRPQLAHQAMTAEPSIAALLPCNVVVRALDDDRTVVEAIDPATMLQLADNEALTAVADEVRERLTGMLGSLADHD